MVREARSASRAWSIPIFNDRSTAKRRETTANDRLLHFMAQLPLGRKRRRVWNDVAGCHWYSLCARCERRYSRAAEQRYERAPLHSITSSASASNLSGISRPSVLAGFRLTTNSYLVGCCTGKSPGFSPLRTRPV